MGKHPKFMNVDVPEDLNEICYGLLRRAPELRADGPSVLERLRCRSAPSTSNEQGHFVGRSHELAVLSQRFCSLESDTRQVVLLQGRSGIGKATLVDEFLDGVIGDHRDTIILRSRCCESETVLYKALDSVADQLVRYLRTLPEAQAFKRAASCYGLGRYLCQFSRH